MLESSDLNSIILKAASGDSWYGSSTPTLLSDISAAQAAARPIEGGHSIWEIVLRMLAWLREVARRQQDGSWRWLIGAPFTVGQ
jgi:hypothetical protein